MFKNILLTTLLILSSTQLCTGMQEDKGSQNLACYDESEDFNESNQKAFRLFMPGLCRVTMPCKEKLKKDFNTRALKDFAKDSAILERWADQKLTISRIEEIKDLEIDLYLQYKFAKSPFKAFEIPHIQFELELSINEILDKDYLSRAPEAQAQIKSWRKPLSRIFKLYESEKIDKNKYPNSGKMPDTKTLQAAFAKHNELKTCAEQTYIIQELTKKIVLPVHIHFAEEAMLSLYFLKNRILLPKDMLLEKLKLIDKAFGKAITDVLKDQPKLKEKYQRLRGKSPMLTNMITVFSELKDTPQENPVIIGSPAIENFFDQTKVLPTKKHNC
ncbi:MAG: hypothetical protein ABH827_02390 [bacterium]